MFGQTDQRPIHGGHLQEWLLIPESRVLVHCAMGVNRSATIVAAWLMDTRCWTRRRALSHISHRHPRANPAEGHMQQLERFQKDVLKIPNSCLPMEPTDCTLL
eukprot:gnl/TRDRNA2_/TRDRNA2_155126_c0_seq1.p1 gnl/TRDRNA2_/TRDRNA2_155126_c0~~gnl/TRDRNA2_/TRDRNA2_155126_c0_seq1.p1  ORF type:complete len:103 (+),score=2.24 gnl/TRDRNA2_/TRDRNA2_155126_c0_seq1:2-310(+)